MKRTKNIIIALVLVFFFGLILIQHINAASQGIGDFYLTDKELPSGWKEKSSSGYGPHMAVREKFMGGSWSARQYQHLDNGIATIIIGYYPTVEEAKKAMHPDVYTYRTNPYTNTVTTLNEWDNKEDNEQISYTLRSGTTYGEEGYVPQERALHEGIFIDQSPTEIFRIGNVIFQVTAHNTIYGILEPLIADKARRILGVSSKNSADADEDGVLDDRDSCPGTPKGIRVDTYGCPEKTTLQKIHQMNMNMITQLQSNPVENAKRKDAGMIIFKDPSIDQETLKLQNTNIKISEIKQEIENTQSKLIEIGQITGGELIETKTIQGTDIKIVQKDENIQVKKDEFPGLYFKLKYSVNQQSDAIIDAVSDKIPYGLGKIFKDYLKSEKDAQFFSTDEQIKKTQVDLGISSTQADLYSSLSGVEDKQISLSPGKNLIPTSTLTKPFEYTLQFMELGIKKTIASQYEKEYLEVKAIAQERRESGDSWTNTIEKTEKQIAETWGYTGYGKHVSYLNTMSKDQVGTPFNLKTQEGRIKLYIQIMREKGELQ